MSEIKNPNYIIFTVYEVHGDGGERGIGPVIGYASTEHSAKLMAARKGFFNSDGVYFEIPVLKIGETIFALKKEYPIDLDNVRATKDAVLRESTLKSLTVEQKRVLGLG